MSREDCRRVLADTGRAGVYRLPQSRTGEVSGAAEDLAYAFFRIDLADAKDKAGLLRAIASAMDFPPWFGHNWDALEDCLTDLSWRPAKGYVALLYACDALQAAAPEDFREALAVFDATAEFWRREGAPFWTLVDLQPDRRSDLREFP